MKKIILSVMACAMSVCTFAQQGTFEVGGALSVSNSNPNSSIEVAGEYMPIPAEYTTKAFNVSVIPSFMYNVTDNIALGTGIGFAYSKLYDFF